MNYKQLRVLYADTKAAIKNSSFLDKNAFSNGSKAYQFNIRLGKTPNNKFKYTLEEDYFVRTGDKQQLILKKIAETTDDKWILMQRINASKNHQSVTLYTPEGIRFIRKDFRLQPDGTTVMSLIKFNKRGTKPTKINELTLK